MLWRGHPPGRCHVAVPQYEAAGFDRTRRERINADILTGMVHRHRFGE
jgi:hypothetical protein